MTVSFKHGNDFYNAFIMHSLLCTESLTDNSKLCTLLFTLSVR